MVAGSACAPCTMQPWQVDSRSSLGLTLIMVQLHGASSTEWWGDMTDNVIVKLDIHKSVMTCAIDKQ